MGEIHLLDPDLETKLSSGSGLVALNPSLKESINEIA